MWGYLASGFSFPWIAKIFCRTFSGKSKWRILWSSSPWSWVIIKSSTNLLASGHPLRHLNQAKVRKPNVSKSKKLGEKSWRFFCFFFFIEDHFQMGNFNCTLAEVKEAKMFTFYLQKDFILPMANDQTFYVCVSQGNFAIRSLEVGMHVSIISFRCPYELLVWNCGHLQANRGCLCDWAPIRLQPCCDKYLFIKGSYTSQKKGNKSGSVHVCEFSY